MGSNSNASIKRRGPTNQSQKPLRSAPNPPNSSVLGGFDGEREEECKKTRKERQKNHIKEKMSLTQ